MNRAAAARPGFTPTARHARGVHLLTAGVFSTTEAHNPATPTRLPPRCAASPARAIESTHSSSPVPNSNTKRPEQDSFEHATRAGRRADGCTAGRRLRAVQVFSQRHGGRNQAHTPLPFAPAGRHGATLQNIVFVAVSMHRLGCLPSRRGFDLGGGVATGASPTRV